MALIAQKRVRTLHRWLGLFFSLSVFMSAGSGIIHSIMSRTQAPPPPARPAGTLNLNEVRLGPAELKGRLGLTDARIQAIALRTIKGEPWYQVYVQSAEKPLYMNAKTGAVVDMDAAYAKEIAERFLGGKEAFQTEYLDKFNSEYINIFRILPVYRFESKDKLNSRVYVSTMTGAVSRHTDDQRQFEANLFSNLHKFMFIKNKDVRDTALIVFTSGILLVALFGILLFFRVK